MKKKKATKKQLVWGVFWDSGGPGAGAGYEEVYLKDGKYYYEDSSSGYRCRASDLQKLLRRAGLNVVNNATVSIDSPVLSAEEIVAMLEVCMDEGYGVRINDEEWVCVAPGVLVREEEKEE